MEQNIKKIGVLTSGGDSPGMNAAIRSVSRTCNYYNIECIGIKKGYQGLIENVFIPLGARSVSNIINRGGTILKSARSKEFRTEAGRRKAYENLKKQNLEGLIVIGGDGSFTGGMIFQKEFGIPVIGIPGTIDNDIFGTDCTIGYDTALNTVLQAIDNIRDTASSHNRLFFIEVMGRDAGFIALNAGMAGGAEEVLIPEKNIGIEQLIETLKTGANSGKTSGIVIVTEGKEPGRIYDLAKQTKKSLNNYEIRVTVLGHIQRGGTPSCFDRVLASRMGVTAVEELLKSNSNIMIGIQNQKIITVALSKAIKLDNEIDKELLRVAKIISV